MYLLFHTFCRLSSMKRNVDTKKNIIFVLEYFSSFFIHIKISLILRLRKFFLRILILSNSKFITRLAFTAGEIVPCLLLLVVP